MDGQLTLPADAGLLGGAPTGSPGSIYFIGMATVLRRYAGFTILRDPDDHDVFKSPLADFLRAAEAAGWADRIHVLRHGETYTI